MKNARMGKGGMQNEKIGKQENGGLSGAAARTRDFKKKGKGKYIKIRSM